MAWPDAAEVGVHQGGGVDEELGLSRHGRPILDARHRFVNNRLGCGRGRGALAPAADRQYRSTRWRRADDASCPVDEALPRLRAALAARGVAVLTAPPGAGKTTRVPLALLDALPAHGRIVMLEPRRLAAVSAARWMARALGEEVGRTVGYAIRFERRVSAATRIEVVTEGILDAAPAGGPGARGRRAASSSTSSTSAA